MCLKLLSALNLVLCVRYIDTLIECSITELESVTCLLNLVTVLVDLNESLGLSASLVTSVLSRLVFSVIVL